MPLIDDTAVQVTRKVTVVDSTAPIITLLGEAEVTMEFGDDYADAGAKANDAVDGDLSQKIEFVNPLNTNRTGTYTLTFNVSDTAGNDAEEVVRKVTVQDTTAPVLTLDGDSVVIINVRQPYEDPGFTSTDLRDGDITEEVVVDASAIDILTLGEYEVSYTSTDAAGNQAIAKRTVIVSDLTPPSITLLGEAEINLAFKAVYVDEGATALDNIDGDLTHSIEVNNPVSSVVPGEYLISYSVTDNANNTSTVTRKVNVAKPKVVWVIDPIRLNQDLAYIEWLTNKGYDVTTPDPRQQTNRMTNAKDSLNASDLILVSQNVDSDNYINTRTGWDDLTTPVILMDGSLARRDRWRWTNARRSLVGGVDLKVKDASDVAFEDTGLQAEEVFTYFNGEGPWLPESNTAGNGKVLAVQNNDNSYITIARWEPGTRYHNDGGWFAGAGTPKGKRIFFGNPRTGNVQDLTENGLKVLENIIESLILEKDLDPPTITIKGNNPFTIMQNGTYTDAGVDLVDNRDPNPKLFISSSNPIYTGIKPGLLKGTLANPMDKTTPNPGNLGIEGLGPEDSEKKLNQGGSAWADNTTIVYSGQIYDADGRMSFTKILTIKFG